MELREGLEPHSHGPGSDLRSSLNYADPRLTLDFCASFSDLPRCRILTGLILFISLLSLIFVYLIGTQLGRGPKNNYKKTGIGGMK